MASVVFIVTVLVACFCELSTQEAIALPEGLDSCHPTPTPEKVHYLIGYGSLINSVSKNRTYPDTGINVPVQISGFKRTWTAKGCSNSSLSTTYLGVDVDKEGSMNGVIFSVPSYEAVKKYDARESFYCRAQVPWSHIKVLRGSLSDNGTFPSEGDLANSEFWIYVTSPTYREFPDEKYPIVQSYVDTFLGGCIHLERKYGLTNFSRDCITTTEGWEYPWVNDRIHPRRPFSYQADAGSIDRLISKNIPDHESRVYQERYLVRGVSDGDQLNVLPPLLMASVAIAIAG